MNSFIDFTTDVKKQHTVPRFLLNHFGFGKKQKKRKLFTFDKQDSRIFLQSVFDATTRNSFYNIENHPIQASLEPILGACETDAAPIIKKIISERSIFAMSDEARFQICIFIAIQRVRTHGHWLRIDHVMDAISDKMGNVIADELEINCALERKNLFLEHVLEQGDVAHELMNKAWILYETDMNHPFYISDNPVVLNNPIDENLGIAVKGTEIYFPISSTLMLALICPSILHSFREGIESINNYVIRNPGQQRALDDLAELVLIDEAYKNGTPLKQNYQNVRFLNHLQVMFAERYVYCEKRKFSLVEEMLKSDDSYKSGPRPMVF